MSFEDIYSCKNCDFEIRQEDELFFYDSDSKETVSYILLMSTAGMGKGFETKGSIYRSYCKCCDKFVKIYVIREGGSNMIQQVYQGIKNNFEGYADKIHELKEIKKREKFSLKRKDGFYLVNFHELDSSYEYFDMLDIGDCEEEVVKIALKDFHETIDNQINLFEKLYQEESQMIHIVVDESEEQTKIVPKLIRSILKINVGYSGEDGDFIKCPQCGNKIRKYVNEDSPCPKCGEKLICTDTIIWD